jgi:hypothetical protein
MVSKGWRATPPDRGSARWVSCPDHGKKLYASRKEARKAGRTVPGPPGGHTNAYPCDTREGWHWGHLGPVVVAGAMSRNTRYDPIAT